MRAWENYHRLILCLTAFCCDGSLRSYLTIFLENIKNLNLLCSCSPAFRKYQYIQFPHFYHILLLFLPPLFHIRTHPSCHNEAFLHPRPSPFAPRTEITSPSVSPEPGYAKPMGALLSKAPSQLLTLIKSMWRSVEATVWKSSQCRDPVPCHWTEGELGKLGEGGWEQEPGKKRERGVKTK